MENKIPAVNGLSLWVHLERLKKGPPPLSPEGSAHCRQRQTHTLSFRKVQKRQPFTALAHTCLPFSRPHFKDVSPFSPCVHQNLMLHGSFSLQGLTETFIFTHYMQVPSASFTVRQTDPAFVGCSHSAAVAGYSPPSAASALGLTGLNVKPSRVSW